jgi:hypothetical protein
MPNIHVTPEAASELRRRIHLTGQRNTVVAIICLDKGADLRRGVDGEAVWVTESDTVHWSCEVIAIPDGEIPDGEETPIFEVAGIRFAFAKRELARVGQVQVTLLNGEPHAHIDA